MTNEQSGRKAGLKHREAIRAFGWLLAALCFAGLQPLHAQERFLLQGLLDAEAYSTNADSYSLTRNDGDLSGAGRLQLWSAWQASSNLQLYAFAELESNDAEGSWETDAELEQLALRYSSNSSPYFVIEAGKILPPMAIFSERNLSSQNPLISRPDFLYVSYPLGVSVTGSLDWLDYRAALVDQPYLDPDYIPGEPGSAYRPDLGLGVTPLQGLRVGLTWSKGPYLNRQVNPALPAGSDWKDYDQEIRAIEFHFSRGYAELNSEWVRARYDVPLPDSPIEVTDYFLEFKYTFTPRVYSALRVQQNQYPFIQQAPGAGLLVDDVTIRSVELGLGYRFSADTQVKLSFKADEWKVENAPGGLFPDGRSIGVQLSHQFDVRSWFDPVRWGNNQP